MANTHQIQTDLTDQHTDINTQTESYYQKFRSRLIGFTCLLLCIITWIGMAEIEPLYFAHTFEKPYFLNYLATISLMLMIIPYFILNIRDKIKNKPNKKIMNELTNINSIKNRMLNYRTMNNTVRNFSNISQIELITMKYKQLLIPSITVSLLFFTNNYLWFISLYYTIASVNTTIYQSQCIFVLIFSILILHKKLKCSDILSVICSIIGVALISLLGKEKENNSSINPNTFGIICCLTASICYALFQVKMNQIEQKYFDQNNKYNKFKQMLFFQFMMGLNILLICWPGFLILNYFNIEQFEFPLNSSEWFSILILTTFSFVFVITYIIGITFTGALFMSIGSLLVVPLTYIVDIKMYHLIITPISVVGSVFIIIGFILMQKSDMSSTIKLEGNNLDINCIKDCNNEKIKIEIQENEKRKLELFEKKQKILSYLPDFSGLSVVEIGCGYGEFTGLLASKSTMVLAVELMQKLLNVNKEIFENKYPHIDYLCIDVMKLDLDCESYDFIFSHYKMMDLDYDEMYQLVNKYYDWCSYGGYIFFVEVQQPYISQILDQKMDLKRISVHEMCETDQYWFLYQKTGN